MSTTQAIGADRGGRRDRWSRATFLVLTGGFGVLACVIALLRETLPREWLTYTGRWSEGGARAFLLVLGALLIGVARGVLGFRRWAWFGAVAYGGLMLVQLVHGLFNPLWSTGIILDGYAMLVVLCLPYLWRRRRDYGIGVGLEERSLTRL